MKILFIKYAAIGDVLNATPAIRALRKRFPSAQIDCLVGKWSHAALKDNPNLTRTILFDENILSLRKPGKMLSLAYQLRKEGYDISICLHRSAKIHAWARLIGAKRRLGFVNHATTGLLLTDYLVEDAYSSSRQHEILYYNEVLSPLETNSSSEMEFFLAPPSEAATSFAKGHFLNPHRKKIGMCAGGARNLVLTESRRQWFLESYLEVIRGMPECDFIVFGADFDQYTVDAMRKADLSNIVDAVGKFPLQETAWLMNKCDAFVTHDTGLMHVASALDIPQVAIFGPTSPKRRAPLNSNAVVLYTAEPCSPCYEPTLNEFAPCSHVRCLRNITPAMVVAALRKALSMHSQASDSYDNAPAHNAF